MALAHVPHDPQESLAATALLPSGGGAGHHRRPEGEVWHETERRIAASDRSTRVRLRAGVGRRKGGADNSISSLAGSGGALPTPAMSAVLALRSSRTYTPTDARARALCCDDVRAERAPRVRGVHEGPWSMLGMHVAHFRPMCPPMCLTTRTDQCQRISLRPPMPSGGLSLSQKKLCKGLWGEKTRWFCCQNYLLNNRFHSRSLQFYFTL